MSFFSFIMWSKKFFKPCLDYDVLNCLWVNHIFAPRMRTNEMIISNALDMFVLMGADYHKTKHVCMLWVGSWAVGKWRFGIVILICLDHCSLSPKAILGDTFFFGRDNRWHWSKPYGKIGNCTTRLCPLNDKVSSIIYGQLFENIITANYIPTSVSCE